MNSKFPMGNRISHSRLYRQENIGCPSWASPCDTKTILNSFLTPHWPAVFWLFSRVRPSMSNYQKTIKFKRRSDEPRHVIACRHSTHWFEAPVGRIRSIFVRSDLDHCRLDETPAANPCRHLGGAQRG